jgi:hypothetical protein
LPLEEMVPRADEPPPVPLTAQVTVVLEVPETVAVNWNESPARMLAVGGETETETEAGVEGEDGLFEDGEVAAAQPARIKAASDRIALAAGRIA